MWTRDRSKEANTGQKKKLTQDKTKAKKKTV